MATTIILDVATRGSLIDGDGVCDKGCTFTIIIGQSFIFLGGEGSLKNKMG